MKTTHFLILFITAALILSCTKEEADLRLPGFEIPVITGYIARDIQGETMMIIGDPNVKLGNESNDFSSEYFFVAYPNPCEYDRISIEIKTPWNQEPKKLWITQASYINQVSNAPTDICNMTNIVIGGSPLFQKEFTEDALLIDLSSFKNGYYRLYLKVDEYLLYDNIVVYKLNK